MTFGFQVEILTGGLYQWIHDLYETLNKRQFEWYEIRRCDPNLESWNSIRVRDEKPGVLGLTGSQGL